MVNLDLNNKICVIKSLVDEFNIRKDRVKEMNSKLENVSQKIVNLGYRGLNK